MKYRLPILLVFVSLPFVGCLSDNIVGPVAQPRSTFPPATVLYRGIDPTQLQLRWTRSISDTQLNFRGYLVLLYRSAPTKDSNQVGAIDSIYGLPDTARVFRQPVTNYLDTSCIFTAGAGHAFAGIGRYTAKVFGVRYPPQSNPDSLVLSDVGTTLSFYDDPNPVLVPTAIYAASGPSATSVNLFWPRSASENNQGFAGYIVRYIDTIKQSGAQLVYLGRTGIVADTGAHAQAFVSFQANVPANPQTLTFREYPYKFWIKAIRKDSVESADSIGIAWSGAERIASMAMKLDTGMFVGQVNSTFAFAQTTTDNPSAEFTMHYDGTNVTVKAISSTTFSTHFDTTSLDFAYFPAPLQNSDFTETSLTLPAPALNGCTFYALLPGGNRARIQVSRDQSGAGYVSLATNTVTLTASFQPGFTGWPFF